MLYPSLPGVLEAPIIATLLGSKKNLMLELSFACLDKESHQLHLHDRLLTKLDLINIHVGDESARVSMVDERTEATRKGSRRVQPKSCTFS